MELTEREKALAWKLMDALDEIDDLKDQISELEELLESQGRSVKVMALRAENQRRRANRMARQGKFKDLEINDLSTKHQALLKGIEDVKQSIIDAEAEAEIKEAMGG